MEDKSRREPQIDHEEDDELIIQQKPVKINGFSLPLSLYQIVSWIYFFFHSYWVFGIFRSFFNSSTQIHITYLVLHVVLLSIILLLGFFATYSKLGDSLLLKQAKGELQNIRNYIINKNSIRGLHIPSLELGGIEEASKTHFCKVCNFYVLSKTKHCGVCNKCIEEFDHHWYFIFFVVTILVASITHLVFVIYSICIYASDQDEYERRSQTIGMQPVFGISLFVLVMDIVITSLAISLLAYHYWLFSNKKTTYEHILERRVIIGLKQAEKSFEQKRSLEKKKKKIEKSKVAAAQAGAAAAAATTAAVEATASKGEGVFERKLSQKSQTKSARKINLRDTQMTSIDQNNQKEHPFPQQLSSTKNNNNNNTSNNQIEFVNISNNHDNSVARLGPADEAEQSSIIREKDQHILNFSAKDEELTMVQEGNTMSYTFQNSTAKKKKNKRTLLDLPPLHHHHQTEKDNETQLSSHIEESPQKDFHVHITPQTDQKSQKSSQRPEEIVKTSHSLRSIDPKFD